MTNTKKSLLVVGGLVLSYALVALDSVGANNFKTPEKVDSQQKSGAVVIQDSQFAQNFIR